MDTRPPDTCPLCSAPLRAAAILRGATGDTLSCRCPSCGRLLFPPGVLAAISGWSGDDREAGLARVRAIRDQDSAATLVLSAVPGQLRML